jgi:hypothetical protein
VARSRMLAVRALGTARRTYGVSMRHVKHAVGLSLLLAATVSAPAFADEPSTYPDCGGKTPSKDDSEHGHNLYIQGKVYYDDGDYNKAIPRFKEAYKVDCTKHELLVIISRSFELKGDKPEALAALETYVARVPTSPDLQTHQNRIANLKEAIKKEEAERKGQGGTGDTPPPSSSNAPGSTTQPPPAGAERGHTVYPWLLAGTGGVAIVTGIILHVAGNSAMPSECSPGFLFPGNCNGFADNVPEASREETQGRAGNAQGLRDGGTIVVVAGALMVAGGLVWHFLEPTGPAASGKLRFTPHVAPGYAGVGLSQRF